jgi:hypothetical protein
VPTPGPNRAPASCGPRSADYFAARNCLTKRIRGALDAAHERRGDGPVLATRAVRPGEARPHVEVLAVLREHGAEGPLGLGVFPVAVLDLAGLGEPAARVGVWVQPPRVKPLRGSAIA